MKIEMRWLDREVPSERIHPMTNIADGRPRERVLQFRQEYNGFIGGYNPQGQMPVVPKWGNWQDVPNVSADTPRQEGK